METVNITNKYQDYIVALNNTSSVRRFIKFDIDSFSIKRANSPKKTTKKTSRIGMLARQFYSLYKEKARKEERVFFNHNYMFSITGCSQRQNSRIIKELEKILDVTYHKSVQYKGIKKLNTYEISEKKCLMKTEGKSLFHQTKMSGEIDTSTYIYKKDNIENIRSTKSTFLNKIIKENVEEKFFANSKKKPAPNLRKKRTVAEIKAKYWNNKPKTLKDYYPMSKERCKELQILCGRDFDTNAMNEILLNMSKKDLVCTFYNDNGFLRYMSSVFKFELRDAFKINNYTFKIKSNYTDEELKNFDKAKEIEKYLNEVENNSTVSQEMHLKKKIASVLKPESAFELLKKYKSININKSTATIELFKHVQLTNLEKDVVLAQVQASHEQLNEEGKYIPIKSLKFKAIQDNIETVLTKNIKATTKTGIWGNIRAKISELLADGDAIDANWFSKLEAEIDQENKQITLKSASGFIKDYVFEKYQKIIDEVAMDKGFIFKGIYSEGKPSEMLTMWREYN